jgi:hypothetical protein
VRLDDVEQQPMMGLMSTDEVRAIAASISGIRCEARL